MNKKYELTNETIEFENKTLHRIRALRDFGEVKAGDLGGFIESETNLSQKGNCFIHNEAKVFDGAVVYENASVRDQAIVSVGARIWGDANIRGAVKVVDFSNYG